MASQGFLLRQEQALTRDGEQGPALVPVPAGALLLCSVTPGAPSLSESVSREEADSPAPRLLCLGIYWSSPMLSHCGKTFGLNHSRVFFR